MPEMSSKKNLKEKPPKAKKIKESRHKNKQMRLLTHSRSDKDVNNEMSNNNSRAVYIFRRPCIQTLRGSLTTCFNFCLRPIEDYVPFCHWGILISTEHPPPLTKPGQEHKLTKPWSTTSSSYELDVPALGGKKVHMGSFERYCPVKNKRSDKLVYLGTTNLSDDEIRELGDLVIQCIKNEGGYHGLWRNCQHFLVFMASYLCPDAVLPTTADALLGGIMLLFKHKHRNMKQRIKIARKFCDDQLAIRVQNQDDSPLITEKSVEG
jgi:hypothetical protein